MTNLSVEGLTKSFGDKRALDEVSLAVKEGEVVGLLGPNGAGKTTAFYLITGLLKPTSGRVYLNGEDVTGYPERRKRLEELLGELGISSIAKRKAYALSGGERRRVEITRTLVLQPLFILLDEPFSGIDPIAIVDIQNIIFQLQSKGIGIIITDHNVRETLGVCDRAYIINEGKILEKGTPEEIAQSKRARQIYLGEGFRLTQ
jgi:lipopolysaccharide export system ATP-binding protein